MSFPMTPVIAVEQHTLRFLTNETIGWELELVLSIKVHISMTYENASNNFVFQKDVVRKNSKGYPASVVAGTAKQEVNNTILTCSGC